MSQRFELDIRKSQKSDKARTNLLEALERLEFTKVDYQTMELICRQVLISMPPNQLEGWVQYKIQGEELLPELFQKIPDDRRYEIMRGYISNAEDRTGIEYGFEHMDISKAMLVGRVVEIYGNLLKSLREAESEIIVGVQLLTSKQIEWLTEIIQDEFQSTIKYAGVADVRTASLLKFNDNGTAAIHFEQHPYFSDLIVTLFSVYSGLFDHTGNKNDRTAIYDWILFKLINDHAPVSILETGRFLDEGFFIEKFTRPIVTARARAEGGSRARRRGWAKESNLFPDSFESRMNLGQNLTDAFEGQKDFKKLVKDLYGT